MLHLASRTQLGQGRHRPRDHPCGRLRRHAPQHHAEGDGVVAVRDEAELEETGDEVGRLARLAELPLGALASLRVEERADLGEHVLDAVPADAHALDGRGMRRPPLAEVDREAPRGVTVEPPARSERLVEVGILGELADHTGHASRSRPRVATRCSGTTFTSASTGMKFVSPAQRGTTCWWR